MKKRLGVLMVFALLHLTLSSVGQVKSDIENQNKKGNAVFLVITDNAAIGVENAVKVANIAKSQAPKSAVVKLNRDDAANSGLIKDYEVTRVPVPFILVISAKGNVAGGYPADGLNPDLLVQAIPSPKQDEAIEALDASKPCFVVISKQGFADKSKVVADCKTAGSKIPSNPAIIEIDFDDSRETAFLKRIGVEKINDKTITVVANATGQITGNFEGSTDVSKLTAAANTVPKSGGCCPGGSGSSGCAPKK